MIRHHPRYGDIADHIDDLPRDVEDGRFMGVMDLGPINIDGANPGPHLAMFSGHEDHK